MTRLVPLLLLLLACDDAPAPFYVPDASRPAPDAAPDAGSDVPDGEIDAGPDVTPATFDPERVYLLGTFAEGSCGRDALEDFDPRTRAVAGFSCSASVPLLRPDGSMVYRLSDLGADHLRRFVPDRWTIDRDERLEYPDIPELNDPRIDTPECASVEGFAVLPDDGTVVYRCRDCAPGVSCEGRWYREGGSDFALPEDTTVFWLGYGGYALVGGPRAGYQLSLAHDGALVADVVTELSDFGEFHPYVLDVRASDAGFLVLTIEGERLTLFEVDETAAVTLVGAYPLVPDDLDDARNCLVAGDRALYCQARRRTVSGEDLVLRFELGASAPEIVHDEADEPLVRQHISYLVTGP